MITLHVNIYTLKGKISIILTCELTDRFYLCIKTQYNIYTRSNCTTIDVRF